MLWQFPASFKLSSERADEFKERLRHFLTLLPSDSGKPSSSATTRGLPTRSRRSWTSIMRRLPSRSGPGSRPMKSSVTSSYISAFTARKRCTPRSTRRSRSKTWAHKIRGFAKDHDVYGYFNNDLSGYAIQNARDRRLKGRRLIRACSAGDHWPGVGFDFALCDLRMTKQIMKMVGYIVGGEVYRFYPPRLCPRKHPSRCRCHPHYPASDR